MEVVSGGIEPQTEQAMKNLQAVLEAGGSELNKVVKTTVRLHHACPCASHEIDIDWEILYLRVSGVPQIDGRLCRR